MIKEPVIRITGDTSLAVFFGEEISPEINRRVRSFDEALSAAKIEGIYETVPAYCSVTVHYEPEIIRFGPLLEKLEAVIRETKEAGSCPASVIRIPVLYGGEYGPDLSFVAAHNHITPEEVIRIHTEPEYLIYMLGFTPGFPYLGGMDKRIAAPRLKTPRTAIPAGSVGIAGEQTGVYPSETPGGWQLIGRTPLRLYDPAAEKPILLEAGMHVRFYPIDQITFGEIESEVRNGSFRPEIVKERS